MSAVQKFVPRYTVRDYALWQGEWELWEGTAIALPPSLFGRHQFIVAKLLALLHNALLETDCDASTIAELDWIVADDTVVRPDVMVICGPPPERYMESVPELVVEVLSDSTRQNDLNYKRQLYQREQVNVYLIVDPDNRMVHIDARQTDGSYSTSLCEAVVELRLCENCQISFSSASLFQR